jgi:O-antigen biosynthesis protein
MQYNPSVDLARENSSHSTLIRLVGYDKKVLDVGCARGYVGRILSEQFRCQVSGIEADMAAAELARRFYQEVITGDVEKLEIFDELRRGPFDVAIFGDVLEHLRWPERVLTRVRSLLAPGGYVLISLPNVATLRLRLRFLRGKFEYTDQGIMDRTHLRFYTLKSARELVLTCGYTIVHSDSVLGPNFGRLLARLKIPVWLMPPSLLAAQFIFKAHPVEKR